MKPFTVHRSPFTALLLLIAFALAACATPTNLSPLQDAYAVRDTIITTKKALNDGRSFGKLTQDVYDRAWATAEAADKIVTDQIKAAHSGTVSTTALADATKKVDEAKAIGGVQ